MGWETIKYTCGHAEQQQMYGKVSERTHRADYLGRGDCPACASAKAAERSKLAGLPALQGSDKQIAWAQDIRATKLAELPPIKLRHPETERMQGYVEALKARSEAKFWIDNRNVGAVDLVRKIAAGA
jgi:hypothetical protein